MEWQRTMLSQTMRTHLAYMNGVNMMVAALEKAKKSDGAIKILDGEIEALGKIAGKPVVETAATYVKLKKAELLGEHGKKDEANAIIAAEGAAADKALLGENKSTAIRRKAAVENARIGMIADEKESGDATMQLIGLCVTVAKDNAKDSEVLAAAMQEGFSALSGLGYSNPPLAKKGLATMREAIAGSEEAAKFERTIESLDKSIQSAMARHELIGKPAPAVTAESWMNGAPVSGDGLKGKVVLLDFWAVWCGPCIATFPHLKEWNEKYADKGLVILGMTNYYEYGWDGEANRPKSEQGISHEAEKAATEKFLAFHGLKHAIGYNDRKASEPGKGLSEQFKVSGIPQAVLIDRKGAVRMIRVGSGEANARALDAMIKQLLAEGTGSTAQGN